MTAAAWASLVDVASARYRHAGHFARHFARGKLRMDPAFQHLLSEGLVPAHARVLDIGCGQGLLASLLQAAQAAAQGGHWPSAWAAAPVGTKITGIEMMPKDVARARAALGDTARFVCGDMRHTDFPACDAVVILDVLHYITVAEQDAVLARVRAALVPGGILLLRVGDASSRRGFRISQWVDRIVTLVRGHRVVPQFGRPLAHWAASLRLLGFEVQSRPMSRGTPFANVLLVARLTAPAITEATAATESRHAPSEALT